jgi:hypothetical protein
MWTGDLRVDVLRLLLEDMMGMGTYLALPVDRGLLGLL